MKNVPDQAMSIRDGIYLFSAAREENNRTIHERGVPRSVKYLDGDEDMAEECLR